MGTLLGPPRRGLSTSLGPAQSAIGRVRRSGSARAGGHPRREGAKHRRCAAVEVRGDGGTCQRKHDSSADRCGSVRLAPVHGVDAGRAQQLGPEHLGCGGDAALTPGRQHPIHLTDVPVGQRAPIIKRYLTFAFGARPHMPVRWNDVLSAFENIATDYPTFRIDRRQ